MNYKLLLKMSKSLLENEPNNLSLLSNASAFLNEHIPNINWVGFYLFDGTNLTLGPFQGKVACNIINPNKGIVGQSYHLKKTLVIPDVRLEDNHIYCDPNSLSEVVIPIINNNNNVWGVLDVDAPIVNRFDNDLVGFLHQFIKVLTYHIDFNKSLI